MSPYLNYHQLVLNAIDPVPIRSQMAEYCLSCGNYSLTARVYGTTRKTIKKIVWLYVNYGLAGLKFKSRAPHYIPHKTDEDIELLLCHTFDDTDYGQDMLQLEMMERYQIKLSTSTINRILHDNERITIRKKKYKRKKECSEWRKHYRALQFFEFDVKYLNDIPNLIGQVTLKKIPKFEYTFRDIISGLTWVAYAWEFNQINTNRFMRVILEHLKNQNVYLKDAIFQADNGGEVIGSTHRKDEAPIAILIEQVFGAKFQTIPAGQPKFNGSVESFHNLVEDEFYDREEIDDTRELLRKSYSFMLRWNYKRKSLTKRKKTPLQIIKEHHGDINPSICNLKPWILDYPEASLLPSLLGGYYVADEVT